MHFIHCYLVTVQSFRELASGIPGSHSRGRCLFVYFGVEKDLM